MTAKINNRTDATTGAFDRQASAFRNFVSRSPGAEFPPERERYHLYVSYACPWAHRTLIVRKLKGLEDIIPFTVVHWHMGDKGWRFVTSKEEKEEEAKNVHRDPLHPEFTHLRDLYYSQDPEYSGRFTVPVLYDIKTKRIVNNESSEIIRMFYREFDDLIQERYQAVDLLPTALEAEIEETNLWTYHDINNGVYKAGFATKATAYESACTTLFESLDRAEKHLEATVNEGPYFFGKNLTETDVRLYTTIVRFDPVYVQHFKCNLRDIRSGYPALHRWLRLLYWDHDAFKCTTNFEHIKKHYTQSHPSINPCGITPLGPVPNILAKSEEVKAFRKHA